MEIKTAENVDLKKYMGKWYEIARFENRFERNMTDVRAVYYLNADSTVRVENSGKKSSGSRSFAIGKAYSADPTNNSKLRVTFFWPFYSDYFILELDNQYQWALVGGSNKDYLWILARTPKIEKSELDKILKLAKNRGYDTEKLIYTQSKEAQLQ